MSVPVLRAEEFDEFFHAIHGYNPFPWQSRLARRVATTGAWPSLLDLPTGTGKTAALDVAVFSLALAAGGGACAASRRVVYVVDRRTIVSQAHDRAVRICQRIAEGEDDVLRRVKARLFSLASTDVPLKTVELRGGIVRDDSWSRTPDQPLIVVSTVDQVGSRLLFRGYGVSDSMKPIHAGLLGNDVLYLLDEVHLSQPFRETLGAVANRYRSWAEQPIATPFAVVEMSATPGSAVPDAFALEEDDRHHEVLASRLRASKPAALIAQRPVGFVDELVRQTIELLRRPGATVGIVVNRVKTARQVHQRLEELRPGVAHLLTGRMRPFDRANLDQSLIGRIRAGRERTDDESPIAVVATQTIEAGADFDFDGLVCECASLDALRQRFGRLDRLGTLKSTARGVVVARTDTFKDDPVYGDAIGLTWTWLNSVATDATVDFGIEAFACPGGSDLLPMLAPQAHAPVLLPGHLDAWVQTAPVPVPDPDVSLWLHGPNRGTPDVQVVWRADLTQSLLEEAVQSTAANEIVVGMVEAVPPVSAEAMAVPFLAVRRWLEGRTEPEIADVEGARDDAPDARKDGLAAVAQRLPALGWHGDRSKAILPDDLRPGQTVIVPTAYGGIRAKNWDPEAEEPVEDVAESARARQNRRPMLRLRAGVGLSWWGDGSVPEPGGQTEGETDDRQLVIQWLQGLDPSRVCVDLRPSIEAFKRNSKAIRVVTLPSGTGDLAPRYYVVAGRSPGRGEDGMDDRVSSDGSGASFTGVEVTLSSHQAAVAALAVKNALKLGLGNGVTRNLQLSGLWHDAGKADGRFQRWLHGGSEFRAMVQTEPLAKSVVPLVGPQAMRKARERSGYPQGGRHELTSVALMAAAGDSLSAAAADWPLVLHLVASHHGRCRPLAPWAPDDSPVQVTFSREGIDASVSSRHGLERLDSGIAERFWLMVRMYGWWGLAYLETILRLADQQQSAREQAVGRSSNG